MTPDDHRAKCIEAMASSIESARDKWVLDHGWSSPCPIETEATAAFTALHSIVRVNPIEATEEMRQAAANYFSDPLTAYETIAKGGDLTIAPEDKP